MTLDKIISVIKENNSIAIMPHVQADGDALGSCIGLGLAMKQLGKKVKILLEEDIPYVYSFLPGREMCEVYSNRVENFDIVLALDTGDIERLGERLDVFNSAKITINIDHHFTNSEYAFYNYVQSSASAVGEIIHQLVKTMELKFDPDISLCLYVAIATDTGGFRFSNTTPLTHTIIADLISNGVNIAEVSQRVFDSTSLRKVKLTGVAISSLELFEKGKIAFVVLDDETMTTVAAKEEDCEGIVNIGRNIEGVEVSVVLRQRNSGEIKVNFRSKSYVDVASIAGMYGGGGHKRAAGCIIEGKKQIDEVKLLLLKDIKEALDAWTGL